MPRAIHRGVPSRRDWESSEPVAVDALTRKHLKRPPSPLQLYDYGDLNSAKATRSSGERIAPKDARVRKERPRAAQYIPEAGGDNFQFSLAAYKLRNSYYSYGFSLLEPILMARLRPRAELHGGSTSSAVQEERCRSPVLRQVPPTRSRGARLSVKLAAAARFTLDDAIEKIEKQKTVREKIQYLREILRQKQCIGHSRRARASRQQRIDEACSRGEYFPVVRKTTETQQERLADLIEGVLEDVLA
ncbi:hypothetical protein FOZ63_006153, partial [Perkinsus olseni]